MSNIFENKLYQEDLKDIINRGLPWEQMAGRSVLITGGTGLVGSGVTDTLIYYNEYIAKCSEQKIQIWVLSRNEKTAQERFSYVWDKEYFHYLPQDIKEAISIMEPIHYIVHAASKGDPKSMMADPVGIIDANVIGTKQVLEFARKQNNCKIVFVSSGEVYGILDSVDKDGICETDCGKMDTLNPRNCYGTAKRMGENLCASYAQEYDTGVTIARLSHTYGPTAMADESRVIFQFLKKAMSGEDIVMKSAGTQIRSWTYLSDAVCGILTILLKGERGQAYNIANNESACSIRELADIIAECAGVKVRLEIPSDTEKEQSSNIEYAVLNSRKLDALGCGMQMDIKKGIERSFDVGVSTKEK